MLVTAASLWPGLVIALFSSGLAWVVGSAVSYRWDERRRRRESDLAALTTFYRVYGEFFATWKLWEGHKGYATQIPSSERRHERKAPTLISPPDVQWQLLERAVKSEAGFEALLVKLASERELQAQDIRLLARFRQAYQTLRESIRDDETLDWRATPGEDGDAARALAYEKYSAFKTLAEYVAVRLWNSGRPIRYLPDRVWARPAEDPRDAVTRLRLITDRRTYADDGDGDAAEWWNVPAEDLELNS